MVRSTAAATGGWRDGRRRSARGAIVDAAWQLVREEGLGALSLRELARRAGITTPTIYAYFDSKHAIYDAMFGASWTEFLERTRTVTLPDSPRAALSTIARTFFDFATEDLARHQLMNLRTIPGFTPSEASYAPAVAALSKMVERVRALGVEVSDADIDLYTALVGGLVDQQWANDPGGTRWARLLDRAMDMYADNLDLPREEP